MEKLNPTPDAAFSPLLNGVWEIISTGSVTSLGLIGFQALKAFPGDMFDVSDVVVSISSKAPRVTAASTMKIGNAKINVEIQTDLVAESSFRLTESFVSAKLGSSELPKTNKAITRGLVVSYLDEELLIVRDKFGSPDVLRRMEKQFLPSTPTSADSASFSGEDGAPGV